MGAQTEKRKQMFIERYEEVENSGGEGITFFFSPFLFNVLFTQCTMYPFKMCHSVGDLSARCHYCTHYSSAIIVASFLVRIEPFSHTFQALQVRPMTPGNVTICTT